MYELFERLLILFINYFTPVPWSLDIFFTCIAGFLDIICCYISEFELEFLCLFCAFFFSLVAVRGVYTLFVNTFLLCPFLHYFFSFCFLTSFHFFGLFSWRVFSGPWVACLLRNSLRMLR